MPPESSDVAAAVMNLLQADAELQTLLPDGVWWDEAPTVARRCVIVSQPDHRDQACFGGRAWEDALFLVQAVSQSHILTNMKAAAARIDALLEDATLTVPGYACMLVARERYVHLTRRDDQDKSILWFLRGGAYRVQVSLVEPVLRAAQGTEPRAGTLPAVSDEG